MIRVPTGDVFVDARGTIKDLITESPLDSVTMIHCTEGAIRGNHYHRETIQWTYVLQGSLRVVTEMLPDGPESGTLSKGEMMISPAKERHAWKALEDTDVLVFTRGPRSGANYESDTIRLEDESRLIA